MPDRERTEAETTVLSCMMNWPDTVPVALEKLTADDFGTEVHRRIFDAFAAMQATGQTSDLKAISGKLSRGEFEYFLTIDAVPTGELIHHAIKILKRYATLRDISDLSNKIRVAADAGEDTSSLVTELSKKQSAVPDALTIYGVDRLLKPGQVFIYFDKRSADLADELIPKYASLAVTHNCKKLSKLSLSILSQRKVIIWRGEYIDAAEHLYALLIKAGATGVRIVRNPSDMTKGFGITEAHEHTGWNGDQILAYIKKNVYDPAGETPPPPQDAPPTSDIEPHDDIPSPFQCLGYDHNIYYFLPRGSNQVVPLGPGQMCESHYITLARMNWWETSYPGRSGANWKSASNDLIRQQEEKGVYDPSRLRGRGAWEDAGRSVLHLGNLMYINGKPCPPHEIKSRYIYEAAASMEYDTPCSPLKTDRANKFLDLCDLITWERPIFGRLLAGWCVIAPICGGMNWRPHAHLTGAAGTGKSWILANIVARIVGKAAVQVMGATTAAAIRQMLGCDARPVIHDEFEAEGESGKNRIKDELELARACSSDNEALVLKGGADGHVKVYRPRAAFLFSSIGVNVSQYADLTRVTVLSLKKNDGLMGDERRAQFDNIVSTWAALMTEEYCCSFRARNVLLLPTIRKNAETFARAGAAEIGTQRAGDQMGALLAGAYACRQTGEISIEKAKEWIAEKDWTDYKVKEEQLDENRCLTKILQTIIRVQSEKGVNHEMNIGELINIAASPLTIDSNISGQAAEATLSRHGIRMVTKHEAFAVSNNHTALERFLEKTPWSKNWAQMLKRLPNAMVGGTMRFAGAPPAKTVLLPLSLLTDGD